jgi:type II secretory pathway pseudopilin PulG
MLAVVVILGLLLIVAIPQIQNQIASKKTVVNEATLTLIYEAADDYVSADSSTFQKVYVDEEEKASYCIRLQDIVDSGRLEAPIKDYVTGEELNLEYLIQATTNAYNEFEYSLIKSTTCPSTAKAVILYEDPTLEEGSYPELASGMIPVIYKNGSWMKASLYDVWYSYENKQWANVVTVNEQASTCKSGECIDSIKKHSRTGYENAAAGTKISMDDINGMYVWIPKYEYKITASDTASLININFKALTDNTASDGFTIHPAFQFGDSNLGGIWVAKFEASAKDSSLCDTDVTEENCNKSTTKVSVKPNKNSLRYISLANAYTITQNMTSNTKEYGLNKDSVDTHIMKNTEWGAVAYLTQSQYGIGNKEVYVNRYYNTKSGSTLTGCTSGGAGTGKSIITTCTNTYATSSSTAGTTTGNIYGIYDMSGGAWEFVMGNYNSNSSNSGIPLKDVYEDQVNESGETESILTTSKIDDKYVDIYTSSSCSNNTCLGGALLKDEFSLSANWWSDQYEFFKDTTNTWLIRGGYYALDGSELLGIFAVGVADGNANAHIGFRPVITIK